MACATATLGATVGPGHGMRRRQAGAVLGSRFAKGKYSTRGSRAVLQAHRTRACDTRRVAQAGQGEQNDAAKCFDFAVVGSGIAGLSYALKVAEHGTTAIITKDSANEGCTQYAQGGVCAVLDAADSVEQHAKDTIVAGAFLNDARAVEVVCREGADRVLDLIRLGVGFTRKEDGALHLTREGGHSQRRIVHAADFTGRAIEEVLLERARAHPNIAFFEHHLAVDLVVDKVDGVPHCFGLDVLDQHEARMLRFVSASTMLASGGAGQVYPNTTNPHVATGDGIAMAFRAGACIENMEFVQFHPTALFTRAPGRVPLVSEAVRGEGGILLNGAGQRFMPSYDSRLELAPRDVVARSIHDQMRRRGEEHVWLDITHKPASWILSRFPSIAASCREHGVDMTASPIPVVPAQHYVCGGVHTGLLGETTVQGLFACGEVACTGLHGANRLASNSLLEGLVFADRAVPYSVARAAHAVKACAPQLQRAAAGVDFGGSHAARALTRSAAAWVAEQRAALRALMWRCCGIVRSVGELERARDTLNELRQNTLALYAQEGVSTPLVELLNLVTTAELMVVCALQRRESRGLHFVLEYPKEDAQACVNSKVHGDLPAPRQRQHSAGSALGASASGYGKQKQPRKLRTARTVSVRSAADNRE